MKITGSILAGAGAVACVLTTGAATAATVSLTNVTGQTYQTLYDGFLPGVQRIVEDFAGEATPGGFNVTVVPAAQNRTTGNSITTPVGTFAGIGGTGGGTSVTGNPAQIQIRAGNNAGRFNVLNSDGNFLDSNDTEGFSWTIENTYDGRLRGMSAFITDPNDAGKRLTASLLNDGTEVFTQMFENSLVNGRVLHLTADFTGVTWTTAVFKFDMGGINDGIGLSNATLHVSEVPLPAAGWMLLAGIGGLAALRRRQKA